MAITERNYLRIQKNDTSYLLLRSNTHFYLVKEDSALTERKYQKLLRLFPCNLQQLQLLGLHVSAFRSENLCHVIIKGLSAGDELEIWLSGDLRRYLLAENYTDAVLTDFFNGYSITRRLQAPWTGLAPKLIRSVTWTVSGVSIVSSLAFLFLERPYWLWSVLCILCQFLSILLIYLFPSSFVFNDRKDVPLKRKNRRGNLLAAMLVPSFALALRTITDFTFKDNAFWILLLISAILYCAVLLPMVIISSNARSRMVTSVAIIFLMVFLGFGTIGQVNYLLDFSSADSQIVVVTDKRSYHGIRATSYYCTVQFSNGETAEISLSASYFKKIDSGDEISIAYHDGFFQIPFYMLCGF